MTAKRVLSAAILLSVGLSACASDQQVADIQFDVPALAFRQASDDGVVVVIPECLNTLAVELFLVASSSEIVWRVEADPTPVSELEGVTVGETPPGFEETVGPMPRLVPGDGYRLHLLGEDFTWAIGELRLGELPTSSELVLADGDVVLSRQEFESLACMDR